MLFNENNFKTLSKISIADSPCVSIFIPTHRDGHVQEDQIRFKNAIAEAIKKLQQGNNLTKKELSEKEAKGFLTSAYDLLENKDFWLHLSDGLAVFIGQDRFEYYTLPINFDPLVYVNNHYYLHPVMPMLKKDDRFFLLALSQGKVRFFEGHAHSITPVKINDLVPANFEAAMALEDPEKSLQMHGSGKAAVHHGHGTYKDEKDWQVEQFCRMVDNGLMEMLHDENAPMIIAGVDELVAVYKNISNYKHIVDAHVGGNPDNDDPALLHEKGWAKMQPYFNEKREEKKERFNAAFAENKASSDLLDIVPAAINGKVDTLFLDKKTPVIWGNYLESNNTIDIHNKRETQSICLVNLAAIKTFEQGGEVNQIDAPISESQVNAIFRY